MRYATLTSMALALLPTTTTAQDLTLTESLQQELQDRSDVTVFNGFLSQFPTLITDLVANYTSGVTLLIPDDEALKAYLADLALSGIVGDLLTVDDIKATFAYHIMVAPLTSENFTIPGGLTVPTFLDGKDEDDVSYNLRSPAPLLEAQYGERAAGQVLFAQQLGGGDGEAKKFRIKNRQDDGQTAAFSLRGGGDQDGRLTAVDGTWKGGIYQIVDVVLSPPTQCSNTIRSLDDTLSALDTALTNAELWDALDNHPNVTCLGPTDAAFKAAGSPEENLSLEDLQGALLDHTLAEPTYTNFLFDGMTIATLSNKTVTVTLNETGIWFNDARVVKPNVLTNNGLIHVLDKVMTVTDGDDSDGDATGTDSPDSTGDPDSAASLFGVSKAASAICLITMAVVGTLF